MDARLFLVRHGEPRQHSDRIFLGQTNVPLSDRGRDEAASAGDELVRLRCRPDHIYSSDLLRARETAEIISARLGGAPIADVAAFRELSMGVWDGKLIEDIRRRFPDEYVKRGDDILNYRVPGGENFHDLQRRVVREFRRIQEEEFFPALRAGGSADFIIVSHLGVIHTLIAELTCEDMSVVMRRRWPTGAVVQFTMDFSADDRGRSPLQY
jgi:probable phosphoglycerate mutase